MTHGTREYTLETMAFHVAGEHTLDGKRPDMELHLVHTAKGGKVTGAARNVLTLVVPFFVASLSFTSYIVSYVSVNGVAIFSWGQPIYMMYTIVYLSVILGLTFRGIMSYSGQDRVALRIFFNGLFLALVLSSLTNLVLPFLGFLQFYILGPVLTSFTFVSFMAYALLKHHSV